MKKRVKNLKNKFLLYVPDGSELNIYLINQSSFLEDQMRKGPILEWKGVF